MTTHHRSGEDLLYLDRKQTCLCHKPEPTHMRDYPAVFEIVSTGEEALDWVLGGIPKGRITHVQGDLALPGLVIKNYDLKRLLLAIKERTPIISLDSWHPVSLPRLVVLADHSGSSIVIRYPIGIEIPKALKFFAHLRITIVNGVARCIKDACSTKQGHSKRLGPPS